MNQSINTEISKIKETWLATSIAYLFPEDFNYWAPDSKSTKSPLMGLTAAKAEFAKSEAKLCFLLKTNQ